MNMVEDLITDIINDYQYCVIAGGILLGIIILLIFVIKLCSIAKSQKNKNKILERIAKVIEQESEPYVIERPDKTEKKPEKNTPVKQPAAEKQPTADKKQTTTEKQIKKEDK